MGIFADKCTAIINPETGRALTGDALTAAREQPGSPRCGKQVKKSARFCNTCGAPAPGGWWKCPACTKWVGNDSNFCWNCNHALSPDRRASMAGGTWSRPVNMFAERYEVGDIKRLLSDGLIISEGTVALVLDAGKLKDVLEPGSHDVDSLARKVNHWGSPPPRDVILAESGDVIIPLRIDGLRSAEELEVRFYGEVIIRLDTRKAQAFVANLMRDSSEVHFEALTQAIEAEVRYAAENLANTSTIEDLVKDPNRRLRFEDGLRETLDGFLERIGFTLIRVSSAEFLGRAYEELRQRAGEVERHRREIEFDQRIREMLQTDNMDQFRSELELETYVAELSQEKGISDEKRAQEMDRLKRVYRHEVEARELEHELAQQVTKAEGDISAARIRDDYTRSKEAADHDERVRQAELALDLKRKKKELKREDFREMAEVMQGQPIETMIALIDDPEKRAELLEVHKRITLSGNSPEQILALGASDSPEAADALREIFAAKRTQEDSNQSRQEMLSAQHAAQLERILNKSLEAVSKAAQAPGNTIINK